MLGSAVVYAGILVMLAGLVLVIKPIARLGVPTRSRALMLIVVGVLIVTIGFRLPVSESRVTQVESRLDQFVPVWHFSEFHTIEIAASPARAYEAITQVRADEIALFNTLTWIRRGGRPLPESILNAGNRESLIDVATRTGFVRLADDSPRELVIGTIVVAPPGVRLRPSVEFFRGPLPQGFAVGVMNFIVRSDGAGGSVVTTETRVVASDAAARRRFARYWRLIYPGSALIRRMWLRAVARRATAPRATELPRLA